MAKTKGKHSTPQINALTKTSLENLGAKIVRRILKVRAFTPICKPLNGSLPSSKTSHLLRLTTFDYKYKVGKEIKTGTANAYLIKGLRGAVRHQVMAHCKDLGLDICHTSDKETDKQGRIFLSEGFHLLGSCLDKNECIIHAVFGSKRHASKIRVSALPIANITHKTFRTDFKFQNVHIATEKRVTLAFDGKPIQDFGERYFSGEFEFEIDVSKCTDEETGMLVEAVMYMQKFGGGINTGYGELQILNLNLVKSTVIREPKITEKNDFTIEEHLREESIPAEFTDALTAWKEYQKRQNQ
ncbi:MAG: RAMP superfamily CRISPR-associated protein [Candidatus Hodarchaeales archaeon]|jgi:hypothetical protein